MSQPLRSRLRQGLRQLTQLEGLPLSRAALVVLLLLDLFIIASLFQGLEAQTRQLTPLEAVIPPLCSELVLAPRQDEGEARLEQLARARPAPSAYPTQTRSLAEQPALHPLCRPLLTARQQLWAQPELAAELAELAALLREADSTSARIDRLKGAYDTRLLEKIAGETPASSALASTGAEIARLGQRLDELAAQRRKLHEHLQQAPLITAYLAQLDRLQESDRAALREARDRLRFWQPFKQLGMELLFLLPLLVVFWLWQRRSLARGRAYQGLVSAHLLVLTTVPLLFAALRLLHELLPRQLLQRFFALLEALRLVAIWHYLVMALAILFALVLIYLLQKRLFSPQRLMLRRLARGECRSCGLVLMRLAPPARHCPACGVAQYRSCAACGAPTPAHGPCCTACGAGKAD